METSRASNIVAIRVASISDVKYLRPNTILVGMSLGGNVWETTTKNLGTMQVRFVDEVGNETQVYWIRPVRKPFQTGA